MRHFTFMSWVLICMLCASASRADAQRAVPDRPTTALEARVPAWHAPRLPHVAARMTREEAANIALRENATIAEAELAVTRAQTEQLRAQGRKDGVFRTALDAMRAETPVDSGITRGTNRQDLLQLNTSLSRRYDSGTQLSIEMQNGYTRTVFPLMISGVLQQQIDSGPNYLNALTLSLKQNLLEGRGRATARHTDLAAEIQVRIAEAQLQAAKEQIVEQVMSTWSQVFFAEIHVALQERSIARTERQIAASEAQLDAGHIAPFERNLLWQRLAQNREGLLVAHQELRSAARALMLLLHRAPQRGVVLTDVGEAVHAQSADHPFEIPSDAAGATFGDSEQKSNILHEVHRGHHHDSLMEVDVKTSSEQEDHADAWCSVAMEHNAQVHMAESQLALAEALLVPAESQRRAQLDLTFGVTSTGLDPDVGESLKKMATVDALTLFGGVEFVARLHNRAANAELQATNIDLATARSQEKQLREQVCYEVVDAYEQLVLHQERSALSHWRTAIAFDGLAAESARFERGRSTVSLVLDALENVELSELEHLRVQLDADAAWWGLQRRVGQILHVLSMDTP